MPSSLGELSKDIQSGKIPTVLPSTGESSGDDPDIMQEAALVRRSQFNESQAPGKEAGRKQREADKAKAKGRAEAAKQPKKPNAFSRLRKWARF